VILRNERQSHRFDRIDDDPIRRNPRAPSVYVQ
jgi:hypothetical protein